MGSPLVNLNQKQHSVLVGSLLGDGTLWQGKAAQNVNFKVEHGLAQRKYVFFKYKIFKEFVGTSPKLSFRYDFLGKRYPKSWWFRTFRHPVFMPYFCSFYKSGTRSVPKNIETLLDPLGLAIWIMDDGSSNNHRTALYLNSHGFELEEQLGLCKALRRKFFLSARVHKDGNKHRIYIPVEDTGRLFNLVADYLLPEFLYKFPEVTP